MQNNIFLHDFLMISNTRTVVFLIVLGLLFYFLYVLYRKRQMDFSIVILIATVLGFILGLAVQAAAGFPVEPAKVAFVNEASTWFALFGNGYLSLIKMIVIPLVMISILHVIINMEQGKSLGILVKRTVAVTLAMTAVASVVGIIIGVAFKVGKGSAAIMDGAAEAKKITPIAVTLKELIPDNLVEAMQDNNIIGLVIFSAFLGIAIWWIHQEDSEASKLLYDLIDAAHKAIVNLALLILDYMPWAVLALLANTIAERGLAAILGVGNFILALYVAVAVQFIIQLGFLMVNGVNPITYLKVAFPTILLAFTSRSSVGCLPMTIETLTEKLDVDSGTASFVAGFGTAAGMQGCAGVFPSLLVIYVCHMKGMPVDITLLVMTIIVVTIGSLGIAGIPGTATMAASVSLSGVGLASSYSMISPILAVDPIIDMPRTLLNVTGSMTNALVVDKMMKKYYK